MLDETEEIEFGELDTQVYDLNDQINLIQPYRNPDLRLDYLGVTGEVELIYIFRVTFQDRDSDVNDYLDEVEKTIEDNIEINIFEREPLGIVD
jgi:hypothetical protein